MQRNKSIVHIKIIYLTRCIMKSVPTLKREAGGGGGRYSITPIP